MHIDDLRRDDLIDLGDATVETRGEPVGVPSDFIALRPKTGLSDD